MEENAPVSAKMSLPDEARSYLEMWMDLYGLDAITQEIRNICAKRANRQGADITKLTLEERRHAKRWHSGEKTYTRCLEAIVDHGPGSGCK